ncbi:hypothetical protein [Nodularia sp. UHCC 0506]|uniref:hypothetical protein n=1 Tax=Nodularia sp. UHCC 0506 TaxID=3110243 RepID=UPI002B2007BB|nr:hypothetical protein [Nodularia sp. UHCC 0506]MEA5516564.1 hypothetical protein [Nodularia sp. UHCC 0506]
MAKLTNAQKAASKEVAEKIARGSQPASTPVTTTNSPVNFTDAKLPGLLTITPETVPGMMPKFNPELYKIEDPLNPPESLPQATQSQFDTGMKVYEDATRAIKLTGAALDLTREKFTVIGKHSKAFGAGVMAATETEKVRGNVLDYLSQKETTSQKGIGLDINQNATIVNGNIAVLTKQDSDEKLKQAEIKSEELRLKTIEAQGKLNSFKQQLGEYMEVSR